MQNLYLHHAYLIDAHPLYCDGYEKILNEISDTVVIGRSYHQQDIEQLNIINSSFNIILFDILSFGSTGIQILIDLRVNYPDVKIIICSDSQKEALIKRCLSLGVWGYIPKHTAINTIKAAITSVIYDFKWVPRLSCEGAHTNTGLYDQEKNAVKLTKKELMTLRYLMRGNINKDIAMNMGVSESTTKSHVSSIIRKMKVINRTQVFTEFQEVCKSKQIKISYKRKKLLPMEQARRVIETL